MAWASQIEAWNDGATLPTGRQCRHPSRRVPLASACQLLANPDEAAVDSHGFVQRVPEAFGNWNSIWRQFRRWCESGVWDVLLQGLADGGGELYALQMIDSTTIRAHRCAAGEAGGIQFQALGRSRGGFTTKVHLRCNAAGLPVGVVLTAGEAHDVTAYDELMEQRDSDPGTMLADKGYDSDAIRHDLQDRGAAPEIPTKSNRKVQRSVSKRLYRLRSRIECFIGHLKEPAAHCHPV